MTNPANIYQELLDQIIQDIRDDDSANSETVTALITRLQELNALATAQFLSRRIDTGNGLTGGGDLSENRTLSLSQAAAESLAKAESSVSAESLAETLKSYLTTTAAASGYATKAEAKPAYTVPFTYGGTVNGSTTSPQIRFPRDVVLTDVSAAVNKAGDSVKVTVTGGASASATIASGQTSAVASGLSVSVKGAVRVGIASSSAEGVTVMLRVQEV